MGSPNELPPVIYNSLSEATKAFNADADKKDKYLVKINNKWAVVNTPVLDKKTRQLVAKSFEQMKIEAKNIASGKQALDAGVDKHDTIKATLEAAEHNKNNYVTATNSKKKSVIEKIKLFIRRQNSSAIKGNFKNFASEMRPEVTKELTKKTQESYNNQWNAITGAISKHAPATTPEDEKEKLYRDLSKNFEALQKSTEELKKLVDEKAGAGLEESLRSRKKDIAPAALQHFDKTIKDISKFEKDSIDRKHTAGLEMNVLSQIRDAFDELAKFASPEEIQQKKAEIKWGERDPLGGLIHQMDEVTNQPKEHTERSFDDLLKDLEDSVNQNKPEEKL